MVRYYHPHESAIRSLFRWSYTLSASVLTKVEFWLYIITATVLTALMDYDILQLPDGVINLDIWKLLAPQLSVTIFSVVFYNNQCFARYLSLYDSCMDVDNSMKSLASEMLTNFGQDPELRQHVLLAVKYCLASIFFFYLSMEDQSDGLSDTWSILEDKGLVSPLDKEVAIHFPTNVFLLYLHWSGQVVRNAVAHPCSTKRYTPPERASMTNRMLSAIEKITAGLQSVRNTQNMPVPFAYFHLLNVLIAFTVWTAGLGTLILVKKAQNETYFVAMFPYVVVTFVLVALRQLAGMMADPFGKDDLDFPTADFMRYSFDHIVALLEVDQRFDGARDDIVAATTGFTAAQVKRPCEGAAQTEDFNKALMVMTNKAKEVQPPRASLVDTLLLAGTGHDLAYGPRNWVKPEHWEGAVKLVRWLDSKESQSGTVPLNIESKAHGTTYGKPEPPTNTAKLPPASPKAEAKATPAPQPADSLKSLQGIEIQMKQLVDVMKGAKPAPVDGKLTQISERMEAQMRELVAIMKEFTSSNKRSRNPDKANGRSGRRRDEEDG
eukprot:TRINITY_DN32613_c0_g1_i1.p1 TRINITY_DN32613_c0_g1~~TRINITY_DN32613_c0_g1_i1.p1  ORF type:complete len:550 (+),score=85.84 TRINITY_DN32613_c0_g1_i1:92-1741(+)